MSIVRPSWQEEANHKAASQIAVDLTRAFGLDGSRGIASMNLYLTPTIAEFTVTYLNHPTLEVGGSGVFEERHVVTLAHWKTLMSPGADKPRETAAA